MNALQLSEALALPMSSHVDQKVPKTVLSEQAATTATDRRAIKEGIEGLWWLASLKPNTIGVPAFADEQREYLEIAVLQLQLRNTLKSGTKATRLIELLHRAIPYPVLLIIEQEDALSLSLAYKRWAQNEKDKMVLEDSYPHITPVLDDAPDAFFHDLALNNQPQNHLFALYQGWLACLLALETWHEAGQYRSPQSIDRLPEQRQQLHKARELANEIARLRKQAARERQMARQVELNLQIKQLEALRSALLEQLT
ncbi:DUF4391 domain-containing protein [Mariprofundus ferrooxydans]|uniref:DUF4391 domain-containing protein n=1 Tax=Mariprofundus ferrooxydans PV-1 TaxID=314345 RepID=Q0F339_9PROT|nr:DUF4391 domain-containing protein [Mariprofundus ferrooxydans]EAU56102.1 hypothetical protein SPV1_04758 [Mariprofundus ferrooxydans PV-1]KON48114.1 hypothetical protein AL013_05065 [Mariprofundus ferrooxydans]